MGLIFYQIWRLADAKDKKLLLTFLAFDVVIWNFIFVPLASTQGILLPSVSMEHINSILNIFLDSGVS